uniref:Myosin light chain 5 n=1 Tax=Pipistrellus kuhlii TaxID=59472 RepID=A0A7J7RVM0_PIPKU|nr:myosin light chain 5 [Pipistrellus kuhlii]
MANRKTKKEGGALRAQGASSNVFSNFEQTQIQEFKEAFTLMDQNWDGFDKEDLKDTYASMGGCQADIKQLLMSQADKMTMEEMLQFAKINAAGNLDYKALSFVLTHEEEEEE